jgi:hypothetical protein
VQDLVKRVDLVLAESERQRRALLAVIQSLQARIDALEDRPPRG